MILVGVWSLNLKTHSISLRQANTPSIRRRCLQLCADIEMRAKRFCRWTVLAGVGFWAGWTVRGSCGCGWAFSISLVLEIRLEVLDSPCQSCACRGLTLGTFKKPSFEPFCVWFLGTLPDRSSQIPYKLVPFSPLLRLFLFVWLLLVLLLLSYLLHDATWSNKYDYRQRDFRTWRLKTGA